MSQTQTNELVSIVLKCMDDTCGFEAPINKPAENITPEIAVLLIELIKPNFVATPEQDDHLHLLINGQMTCPVHGRKSLGYIAVYKVTLSADFLIEADGNVSIS